MTVNIGNISLDRPVIAAPMAGVSDRPYRLLAREMGAGLAVSEMITSKLELRNTTKTRYRMDIHDEQAPVVVQLVGTNPRLMSEAAKFNVDNGADMIDINMGCPAKKVCKKLAGSALLGDEPLVASILESVVSAVDVPVTLKIRTGLTPENKNAVTVARIAERSGIQALAIHGRTRQCRFKGEAEYQTIANVKQSVSIPVIANGDIDSPETAKLVMLQTNADAVMIGRAAQGQPWLFQQIADYLDKGHYHDEPNVSEKADIILKHIRAIHEFYGERQGVKFARKHISWYLNKLGFELNAERSKINQQNTTVEQLKQLKSVLETIQILSQNQLPAA